MTSFKAIEDSARRFTVNRSSIGSRFDAEPFAPEYREIRRWSAQTSEHVPLNEAASVIKPPGRYKTLYVEDEQYGVKMLSGRNVAQYRPIAMKIMAESAWENPEGYRIAKDTVLMTCDGRAEENLADCALVRDDRVDWAASGHVVRLVPKSGTNPGLLYLACVSPPIQAVLKSLATGSVIDALSAGDIGSVVVPLPTTNVANELGDRATKAW